MTTAQKIKKLEEEVATLKSLFLQLVPLDKEGEYKASFVRDMKKAASEPAVGTLDKKDGLLALL